MNKLHKLYKYNKTARQTLLLFSAQIFSLGIGFIANMLLAKEMGAQQNYEVNIRYAHQMRFRLQRLYNRVQQR